MLQVQCSIGPELQHLRDSFFPFGRSGPPDAWYQHILSDIVSCVQASVFAWNQNIPLAEDERWLSLKAQAIRYRLLSREEEDDIRESLRLALLV